VGASVDSDRSWLDGRRASSSCAFKRRTEEPRSHSRSWSSHVGDRLRTIRFARGDRDSRSLPRHAAITRIAEGSYRGQATYLFLRRQACNSFVRASHSFMWQLRAPACKTVFYFCCRHVRGRIDTFKFSFLCVPSSVSFVYSVPIRAAPGDGLRSFARRTTPLGFALRSRSVAGRASSEPREGLRS